tara:strand:+ start:26 stop:604 length:579 start_codon:yes stop_codon:yes gene_type:complete
MANKDAAFGLRPVGKLGSDINNAGTSKYIILDGYGTAIYKGDPVLLANDGTIQVQNAATTNNIGVFNGCFYNDPTTQKPTWKNYYPGSITPTVGDIEAYVYDDPNQLFLIQDAGTLAQTNVGNNADIATYVAGSTINGQSKVELSSTAAATAATFRIVRISEDPENSDISSANANWVVRYNEHLYYDNSTGI